MRGGGPATGTVNSIHCSISIPKRKAGPLGQGAASSSKSRPFIFRWKSMPLSQAGQRIWPRTVASAFLRTCLNMVNLGRANFMLLRFSWHKIWMTKSFRLETCCKTRRMPDAVGTMRLTGHYAPALSDGCGLVALLFPPQRPGRKERLRLALRQPMPHALAKQGGLQRHDRHHSPCRTGFSGSVRLSEAPPVHHASVEVEPLSGFGIPERIVGSICLAVTSPETKQVSWLFSKVCAPQCHVRRLPWTRRKQWIRHATCRTS